MQNNRKRPRAYDPPVVWEISQILDQQKTNNHPALESAIFVVHGMGKQGWTETAANLREGFEDVTEIIENWQKKNEISIKRPDPLIVPFIYDGFWANYDDLKNTFPIEWEKLIQKGEKAFFEHLWRTRPVSSTRTFTWLLRKQFLLLFNWEFLKKPWNLLIYVFLQVVGFFSLSLILIIRPKFMKEYLADVRLYCEPKGEIEQAIVQKIDRRVGEAFLKMLGMDWDFKTLIEQDKLHVSGKIFEFKRIVWVAHSLGTVVSYNVLSDLFARAQKIETSDNSTESQIKNVSTFRSTLCRFVTMGSPLDKIAFIFKEKTLRPWFKDEKEKITRSNLLETDGEYEKKDINSKSNTQVKGEWWINFYHVLDPVSGSLSAHFICGDNPPYNYHLRTGWVPLWAHLAYWKDKRVLRFILGRTYGSANLEDKYFKPWPAIIKIMFAILSYFFWFALLGSIIAGIIYLIV